MRLDENGYLHFVNRRKNILFLSELPISATQKIQRGAVKKLAGTQVENNACIDLRKLKVRKSPDH